MSLSRDWLSQFPLRARGRHIVNQQGERFKLSGVNWAGASDVHHVVGGLNVQSLSRICKSIAEIGFSVVRLPFSNQMLRADVQVPEEAIDYNFNPGLAGLSPLKVLDCVIDALGEEGVAVIINNHTTVAAWSGGVEANGLWFLEGDTDYTEEQWIADWLMLAERYKDRPHVIGYDLRNEVRPTSMLGLVGAGSPAPDWGSGGERDWARAAGNCARALTAAFPEGGLIIVERIAWPQQSLEQMLLPVPPWEAWCIPKDRIVLSLHSYSWSGHGSWTPKHFSPAPVRFFLDAVDYVGDRALYGEMEERKLYHLMDLEWGRFLAEDVCPVWLSEFGADLEKEDQLLWFEKICAYLEKQDADFAYWPINVGPKPGGEGDERYGLLTNDWLPRWADARVHLLQRLMPLRCQGRFHMRVPFLAPYPWCAPLPGPLAPWPDEGLLMAAREVPPARHTWRELLGQDVALTEDGNDVEFELLHKMSLGENAKDFEPEAQHSPSELKRLCLEGGFEGFTLRDDVPSMLRSPVEALFSQVEGGHPEASVYVCDEVRPCAVWTVAEAAPADSELEAGVWFEGPGDSDALVQACQTACLAHGHLGFEVFADLPNLARLYPSADRSSGTASENKLSTAGMACEHIGESESRLVPANVSKRSSCQCSDCCCGFLKMEQSGKIRRSFSALEGSERSRRFHLLRRAYVRIGLQSFPEQDAFPGSNAHVIAGASFAQCRQCCLEHGFGGFALYRGDAYFRTATAQALQRYLQPGFPETTFYVLTAEMVTVLS